MKTKSPRKRAPRRQPSEPRGVKAKLVQIGNSRGVRIPKVLLEKSGLGENVRLRVFGNGILVEGTEDIHARWEEQFRKAIAEHGNALTEEDREWLDAPLNAA